MTNPTDTDPRADLNTPEHRALAKATNSAIDVLIHLTGLAASLRFVTAEMNGPTADALRGYAQSAEDAARHMQAVIEHLEHSPA